MSTVHPSPAKLGKRDRLRRFLLPTDRSPPGSTAVTSAKAATSLPESLSTPSTVALAPSTPSIAGAPATDLLDRPAALISSQVVSAHIEPDFLHDALNKLSDRNRATIEKHILPHTRNVGLAVEQALSAAKEKQEYCLEKRWKFIVGGQEFVLKEEADKVVRWLHRFKAVGDVAASIDPVHAGLPWAGISLMLEATLSDANQMASLLTGCEAVFYVAERLKAYIIFWQGLPITLTRSNFERAITRLYACILQFLAQALQIYEMSTIQRKLSALWNDGDVENFQQECDKLAQEVEIEARNCDRTLHAEDRGHIQKTQQDLQELLQEISNIHSGQALLRRIDVKLDLDKLPYAEGASFDSYDQDHTGCHPTTRVDLLRQIRDWALDPHSKSIFWLNGMAGTGKSTISYTFAQRLDYEGRLGASFFFKRGEGDRGKASRFFSTIIRDMLAKVQGLDTILSGVIASDRYIFDKALGEQFKKLVFEPLKKVKIEPGSPSTFVVVVDALDECEKPRDIETILDLWSKLSQVTHIQIKLFLTSRPDIPVLQKFKKMSLNTYQDMILDDEVPRSTIQQDLFVFLRDKFSEIRENYNADPPSGTLLNEHWPGSQALHALVEKAVPLFIAAATIYRFVGDSNWDPQQRLETMLHYQATGDLEPMEQTYLPVPTQLSASFSNSREKEQLHEEFRLIVGSIITLAEPLSIKSLATLLEIPRETIALRLRPLQSVLRVSRNHEAPVRTLHLSFREFLLSKSLQEQPFGINDLATHQILLTKCLGLLSGLHEDLCNLQHPGQLQQDIDSTIIAECLSPALQYACRYWVYHAKHSQVYIHDNDKIHVSLQKHLLHWLEALGLITRVADAIGDIGTLQSIVSIDDSTLVSSFLEDARRFVLANRRIIDMAPLQIYSSAIIFAPQQSIVRQTCGQIPSWIQRCPNTSPRWSAELQKLEGHTDPVTSVAFSPDGTMLASASRDPTFRLWNAATGQEVQKLEGHTDLVTTLMFSPDRRLLASASLDSTVRLWDVATGQEVQKLGHTDQVSSVAFLSDGMVLASGSGTVDYTVRLWDVATGQEVQKLCKIDQVSVEALSPDCSLLAFNSNDCTVRLWSITTDQEVKKLNGHTDTVTALTFSADGTILASGSQDHTVRLWNPVTGQEVQKLSGHTRSIYTIAFSPNGSLLASGGQDSMIRLWNVTTSQEVQKFASHTNSISASAFSPDGSQLVSGSLDRTVRLWTVETSQEASKREDYTTVVGAVAFSPDGSLLAIGLDDFTARLWNTVTGQEVQKLEGHTRQIYEMAFSPDGTLLASGSMDHTIRLWNLATGREIHKLQGHTDWVTAVSFSADGTLLATGSNDHTLRMWNVATGQEVQNLKGYDQQIYTIAVSPDGTLLASESEKNSIRLLNQMGQELQKLEGHTSLLVGLAFSPDGALLASGSLDQTVRLWDVVTGRELTKIGNLLPRSISFTADLATIVTNRGTLHIEHPSGSDQNIALSTNTTTIVKGEWIQQNDLNLLWLPHEYRSATTAYHNNTFAFGLDSGPIHFLELGRFWKG